jgi:MFS family permease
VLVGLGTIRAFSGPAGQALMPNLVPRDQLERAVALGSSNWQLAMIAGPSLGGVLYAATGHAYVVYGCCAVLAGIAACTIFMLGPIAVKRSTEPPSWKTLLAGIRYVRSNKPILGSISLDLFAVLLGGAVALLPIFARDILHIGAWGLGVLRSAPAIGAAVVALVVAWSPVKRHAGKAMFACVLLFGIATIVFGVSKNFALSLVALITLGAADMVSVVIRSTLIQMHTPDEMRGRVSAVNMVFIGASNELGEFESGLTAAWFGPMPAVVIGGIGTCIVVVVWSALFPELRDVDRMDS